MNLKLDPEKDYDPNYRISFPSIATLELPQVLDRIEVTDDLRINVFSTELWGRNQPTTSHYFFLKDPYPIEVLDKVGEDVIAWPTFMPQEHVLNFRGQEIKLPPTIHAAIDIPEVATLEATSPADIPKSGTYLIRSEITPYKWGYSMIFAETIDASVFA